MVDVGPDRQQHWTVGRLARRHDLSRSTLLYYDRIGLLQPSGRTESNYRTYSAADARRLEQICAYREAGLSLKDIARALDAPDGSLTAVLERRLESLNEDILRLRGQQRLIAGLLGNEEALGRLAVMSKEAWVGLLRASGYDDEDMARWHIGFERHAPAQHQAFLEFLCIPDEEIATIRAWSADGGAG